MYRLFLVSANLGYPGLKGRKTVVVVVEGNLVIGVEILMRFLSETVLKTSAGPHKQTPQVKVKVNIDLYSASS